MATKPKTTTNADAQGTIEAVGLERICEMIIEGKLLREICREIGVASHASLILWISKDAARQKAVEEARKLAAYSCDEGALQAIRDARNKLELSKAREEASHQRWRASKMNPKFSDKIDLNHSGGVTVRIRDYTGRKKDPSDV